MRMFSFSAATKTQVVLKQTANLSLVVGLKATFSLRTVKLIENYNSHIRWTWSNKSRVNTSESGK